MVGPTVIGTAAAGKQLTGLSGTWGGFDAITYHFQWFRCNAAGRQLPLGSRRDLADLRARQQGCRQDARPDGLRDGLDGNGVGVLEPRRADRTAPAAARVDRRSRSSPGRRSSGRSVQVTTGTWSPTPPKLTYAWERCNANGRVCAAIPNATEQLVHGRERRPRPRAARGRPGDERHDDPERVQHRDAGGRRPLGHGPVASRGPDRERHRDRRGSSSARRPGSGRASARSRSPSVVPLRPDGLALHGDPRRDPDVYTLGARDIGKTIGLALTRGRLDREDHRVREPDRPGRGDGRDADTDDAADDLRHRPRRRRARRRSRASGRRSRAATPTRGCAATRTGGSARRSRARPAPRTSRVGRRRRAHDRGRGHGERRPERRPSRCSPPRRRRSSE